MRILTFLNNSLDHLFDVFFADLLLLGELSRLDKGKKQFNIQRYTRCNNEEVVCYGKSQIFEICDLEISKY